MLPRRRCTMHNCHENFSFKIQLWMLIIFFFLSLFFWGGQLIHRGSANLLLVSTLATYRHWLPEEHCRLQRTGGAVMGQTQSQSVGQVVSRDPGANPQCYMSDPKKTRIKRLTKKYIIRQFRARDWMGACLVRLSGPDNHKSFVHLCTPGDLDDAFNLIITGMCSVPLCLINMCIHFKVHI